MNQSPEPMDIDALAPVKLAVQTVTISNGRNLYKFDETTGDSVESEVSTVTLRKDAN